MIAPYLITAFVIALVPFLPTEPVLVGLGVLAATGQASLAGVIAVAALGCAMSDHLLYGVTRLTGGSATHLLVRGKAGRAVLAWLSRNVARWGPALLVAGRWLPAGGTVGALLAGLLGWKLRRFTPVSVIGSLLWTAYATMLGYVGGALTGQPVVGLLVSLAIAVLGSVLVRFMLGRRAPVAAEAVPLAAETVVADPSPARAGRPLTLAAFPGGVVPTQATGSTGRAMAAVFLDVPGGAVALDLADHPDLPTVPDNAAGLEPLETVAAE